jgi:hypothetical protein
MKGGLSMGEARRVVQLGQSARVQHGQPQQIQIQIDPEKDKPVACVCGCIDFEPAVRLYRISAVHPANPTGKDLVTKMGVLVCRKCGEGIK